MTEPDPSMFLTPTTKGVAELSAHAVQQQIVKAFSRGWWLFVLGDQFSSDKVVRKLIQRYYPGDTNDWCEEWIIDHSQVGVKIHVVALDCKYATQQQISDMLLKDAGWLTDEMREQVASMDQSDAQIFIPIVMPPEESEVPIEAVLAQADMLRQLFDGFIKHTFDVPFHARGLGDIPTVIPQIIASRPEEPVLIEMTEWVATGNPFRPFIRFGAWILSDGLEFTNCIMMEIRNEDDLVSGKMLTKSHVQPVTTEALETAKVMSRQALVKCVEKATSDRERVLNPTRSQNAQTQGSPPDSRGPEPRADQHSAREDIPGTS